MKKIFLLLIFFSGLAFSQMPNIEKVWLNESKPYVGNLDQASLKVRISISEQDRKNDQEYFVAGNTLVDGSNLAKFEGKMSITKYRGGKRRSTVYGEYEFAEEPAGQHSGVFKGKFIYTFFWNRKSQQIERQFVEFVGNWTSYDGTFFYKTNWNNNQKKQK